MSNSVLESMVRGAFPLPAVTPLRHAARLSLEAFFFTACALTIAAALHVPESGFFAIFLAAAGLTGRFDALLDDNRLAIRIRKENPWPANLRTALGVLGLFTGLLAAFTVAALWVGEARMAADYRFVLDAAGSDTILTRRFAAAIPLFVHNALVLLLFLSLAFIYRSYGALLALSWNACVWGLVLVFLVKRGLAGSGHPVLFVVASAASVLPHLALEATGYVIGSLAAIFLSRGLTRNAPGQEGISPVWRAAAILILIALGCLFLGAVIESVLPRAMLSWMSGLSH